MFGFKPRDNKRTILDPAIASFSISSMILMLYLTLFLHTTTSGMLTYQVQVILQVIGIFTSLLFGYVYNQKKTQKLQTDKFAVGEIVFTETVQVRWFWSIPVQLLAALFFIIPWLFVSISAPLPLVPVFIAWFFTWIWLLLLKRLMPYRYFVTEKGIWIRKVTDYSFIYFDDLEDICYDANRIRFQLITGSPKWTSYVNCDGFIILSIKPERKLQKESVQQPVTVVNPQAFLAHVPNNLITYGGDNVST